MYDQFILHFNFLSSTKNISYLEEFKKKKMIKLN